MKNTLPIIQIDEKHENQLRLNCLPVSPSEFGSEQLLSLINTMKVTLSKEEDGVALAAPQVAVNKQIFIISPLAFKEEAIYKPLIFINPQIIKTGKRKREMQEGCLSVRWIYGKTKRYMHVTIEAYDEFGKHFIFGASGLIAHIFQHETDHLKGILFIDHGYDLEEYTEEEIRDAATKNK